MARPTCALPRVAANVCDDFCFRPRCNLTCCLSLLQFLTRLSFSEFEELLEIGSRERLSDIDARLLALEHMPVHWYQGLARVLVARYSDHCRYFASSDGLIQYVVRDVRCEECVCVCVCVCVVCVCV